MSVIAEARELATEIVAIESHLIVADKDAAALEFASDCKLGLTLAHLIVEGYVTRVDTKALALLDNAVARGRQIAARKDEAVLAAPAGPLDLKAAGPIFPVGTEVVLFADHWADQTPDRAVVVKAEWDGDGWEYKFQAAEGAYFVYEGDLAWHIEEYCADEI